MNFDNYECEGQLNIFEVFDGAVPLKINKKVRLIELFGGIGSQAMALERLGVDFEHYRLIEWEQSAVNSYNAIHGTNFEKQDITKISAEDLQIVQTDKFCYIMTYSFPCQDLSVAGNMKGMAEGSETRSSLLWQVKRLLDECTELPQILLMENVQQVHSEGENRRNFQKWLNYLSEKGYKSEYRDMNACNYGIPQNRVRCFCLSWLGNYVYKFPQTIPLNVEANQYLEDCVSEDFYIKGERSEKLLDNWRKNNKILTDRQTDRQTDNRLVSV